MKWVNEESRVKSIYWALLFIFDGIIISIKKDYKLYKSRVYRGYKLLRDDVESIGETCRLGGCSKNAVGSIENDKSVSDNTPLCRKHYIIVKSLIYGVLSGLLILFVSGYLYIVFGIGF